MSTSRTLASYVFPVILIALGGIVLGIGMSQGQNVWVKAGAGLTLVAGILLLLQQMGMISRTVGGAIGLVCAALAVFLGYRDYRSVAEVLEQEKLRQENDAMVKQSLKDMRTALLAYKQANGTYTADARELTDFIEHGTMPVIRAIGQRPDTLSEEEAIALKIIIRDTIQVSPLDSLFLSPSAQEKRQRPFVAEKLTVSPTSGKTFIMKAGVVNSGGRDVPVFLVKDPAPFPGTDTLMVGGLEKPTTAGNWSGE